MTLTVGGTAGGWALTPSTFASTNASGGANASLLQQGITLGKWWIYFSTTVLY